jgi:hypothetical protein
VTVASAEPSRRLTVASADRPRPCGSPALPPVAQFLALLRERVGGRFAGPQPVERLVDADVLAHGDHPGGDRRRALPAGAAVEIDGVTLIEPAVDLADGRLEGRRRQVPEVDHLDPALGDRVGLQRDLDLEAGAVGIFAVLDEVEHPVDALIGDGLDIVGVEGHGADDEVGVDGARPVLLEPLRHDAP